MGPELTPDERDALVAILSDSEAVARDPFGIAQRLCELVNTGGGASTEFPSDVQELVIRAREQRDAFGSAVPVIDGLVRERGLFPYLVGADLGVADQIALEMHRPFDLGSPEVFHREQAEVYHRLLGGENVALSAPTSFGKSLIVDAVLADRRHSHAAVIVPTIALIDETRRRLFKRFGREYKIVTHAGQAPTEQTIYISTPERVPEIDGIKDVSFFVIDEFYKLDPLLEPERSEALNEALYRLHQTKAQFYLLGPNIGSLPDEFTTRYPCRLTRTDYATVATEVHRVMVPPEERLGWLAQLVRESAAVSEPTLVYCGSPPSARRVARDLALSVEAGARSAILDAVDWISENYHPEWGFVAALSSGVGLHYGPMPRALQQFVARAFNDGVLDVLVCTSTLIEGVNTTAKNVIVYDSYIGDRALDFFTYQNIRGRSGRMRSHFVGRVFVFDEPPAPTKLHVDVPVATQGRSASDSLLIQMEDADLTPEARERVQRYYDQSVLPLTVLRANHGIDPNAQIRLAEHIHREVESLWRLLSWRTPTPGYTELRTACELIWEYFIRPGRPPRGARTAAELAFLVRRFSQAPDVRSLIEAELSGEASQGDAAGEAEPPAVTDPDAAVEKTLNFLRNWANYHFPRYLMALSRIQEAVFTDLDLTPGDYSALAQQVQSYFLPAGIAALDEYGIPIQVGRKLAALLGNPADLDTALEAVRRLDLSAIELHPFELELLTDALRHL